MHMRGTDACHSCPSGGAHGHMGHAFAFLLLMMEWQMSLVTELTYAESSATMVLESGGLGSVALSKQQS